ncbi:hypothetical protein TNIN_249481 [Trichonephila inaurata madagascariensis]|uniref:Uncharacterized protein n=1 Tax=Trichonephila inaurata madagascariensis TaxID=2747483 RepID=A0A8X6XH49_9ARAC|nr:hypothetical protein TNIN_249481 [Trichonephila inaurata madagascariensis]
MLDEGFLLTTPSFQRPLIGPLISRGTTQVEKYRFYPPSARQIFAFQHFGSHFGALTYTLRLRTRVSGCVGHSDTRSIPLRDTEGRKPCQRSVR